MLGFPPARTVTPPAPKSISELTIKLDCLDLIKSLTELADAMRAVTESNAALFAALTQPEDEAQATTPAPSNPFGTMD